MAQIIRITLAPIKSFDRIDVPEAELRENGSLRHDREYKFVDEAGDTLDSLSNDTRMYRVRVAYTPDLAHAHFSMPGVEGAPAAADFDLQTEGVEIAAWMSAALGQKLTLQRNDVEGFCDDQELAGPTIISQATLDRVAELSNTSDVPRRLRSNIVLDGMRPYGEDGLSKTEAFSVGDLSMIGAASCARCVVASRDPATGRLNPGLAPRLWRDREKQGLAPATDPKGRATHNAAAINTLADGPQSGRIAVGDRLEVKQVQPETVWER